MEALIEQYKQGGLSVKEICTQNQVGYHTLQYWRYKEKRHARKNQAVFLSIRTTARPSEGKVLVSYPNGVTVSLDCFDPNQILQLLQLGNV
ncbi:MAG: hypothetical protein IPH58_08330 [Sphingobacteriales bacterium]|jgi:transposase-like protein|nr:hypothetical protein [Sphingobacteriales bacterium]MBK7098354.1 hypothetical protein [Sphingobacteriales bacterium]